jgi:hypothetical protein
MSTEITRWYNGFLRYDQYTKPDRDDDPDPVWRDRDPYLCASRHTIALHHELFLHDKKTNTFVVTIPLSPNGSSLPLSLEELRYRHNTTPRDISFSILSAVISPVSGTELDHAAALHFNRKRKVFLYADPYGLLMPRPLLEALQGEFEDCTIVNYRHVIQRKGLPYCAYFTVNSLIRLSKGLEPQHTPRFELAMNHLDRLVRINQREIEDGELLSRVGAAERQFSADEMNASGYFFQKFPHVPYVTIPLTPRQPTLFLPPHSSQKTQIIVDEAMSDGAAAGPLEALRNATREFIFVHTLIKQSREFGYEFEQTAASMVPLQDSLDTKMRAARRNAYRYHSEAMIETTERIATAEALARLPENRNLRRNVYHYWL